ncbi:MAG: hypothetical protein D4R67_09615 [Bacteroidetes bacterium]|nr:MAG: hypothetical protein D4R67_09615 [Bacteroidota bacterium]
MLVVGVFVAAGGSLFAQKIKSGSFAALQGQTVVNLEYDYSNMAVGKFKKEADYVAKRTADMNKKEAGSGDTWAQAWVNDRSARFHPMFEKNFNGNADKCGLTGKEAASDAKYTLIIRTIFTEPGFNVGVTRQNAYINMLVDLVETADPGKVLGSIEYKNVQSVNMMGYDFDTGGRIQSCYDRAGDKIANTICKAISK